MVIFCLPGFPASSQLFLLLLASEGVSEGREGELEYFLSGETKRPGSRPQLLGERTREDSLVVSAEHSNWE